MEELKKLMKKVDSLFTKYYKKGETELFTEFNDIYRSLRNIKENKCHKE